MAVLWLKIVILAFLSFQIAIITVDAAQTFYMVNDDGTCSSSTLSGIPSGRIQSNNGSTYPKGVNCEMTWNSTTGILTSLHKRLYWKTVLFFQEAYIQYMMYFHHPSIDVLCQTFTTTTSLFIFHINQVCGFGEGNFQVSKVFLFIYFGYFKKDESITFSGGRGYIICTKFSWTFKSDFGEEKFVPHRIWRQR